MGRRLLQVSTDLVESILRHGVGPAVPEDVPNDIEIVKASYSPVERRFYVEVRSKDWPDEPEDAPLYSWCATFRRVTGEPDAREFLTGLVLGAVAGAVGSWLAFLATGVVRL